MKASVSSSPSGSSSSGSDGNQVAGKGRDSSWNIPQRVVDSKGKQSGPVQTVCLWLGCSQAKHKYFAYDLYVVHGEFIVFLQD